MITDTMRAAGWREMPTPAVMTDWHARGGRWLIEANSPDVAPWSIARDAVYVDNWKDLAWMPVWPTHWQYDARGWADPVPSPGTIPLVVLHGEGVQCRFRMAYYPDCGQSASEIVDVLSANLRAVLPGHWWP